MSHNDKPNKLRIRQEDLQEAVFSPMGGPHPVISQPEDTDMDSLVFCMAGREDDRVDMLGRVDFNGYPLMYDEELADGREVPAQDREGSCAKIDIKNSYSYYYIRRGVDGRFFDPLGLYDRNTRSRKMGEDVWKYVQVKPSVMRAYLQYLKTKNKAHLLAAEREAV